MKPLNASTAKILETITAGLDDPSKDDANSRRVYDNGAGFMAAVVERIGANRYSVAHYYEQNGDKIADPDLELVKCGDRWFPAAITHPPPFGYRRVLECDASGNPVRVFSRAYADLRSFAATFLRNVQRQQKIKLPTTPRAPSSAASTKEEIPVEGDVVGSVAIGRVTYEVEKRPDRFDSTRPMYVLRGPKGAVYCTARNRRQPECMFLINMRRFAVVFDGVWLTDRSGSLEVM